MYNKHNAIGLPVELKFCETLDNKGDEDVYIEGASEESEDEMAIPL